MHGSSPAPSILITGARVVGVRSDAGPLRGESLGALGVMPAADVLIEQGMISAIAPAPSDLELLRKPGVRVIDARGCVLMAGLVDCHTHACWTGERVGEWEMKLAGVPYLEILRRGGGIMSTVRAVRSASQRQLTEELRERLARMLALGTTTVEVKSGYGLCTQDELKMLRAIHDAAATFPGTVIATALLGHALDPDVAREVFVRTTIDETLPAVSQEFPGIAVDAYCETAAWSVEETLALLDAAHERGHPSRVHADQFTSLGMTKEAARRGFVSVDHLEASVASEIAALGASATAAVLLPVCGLHLDGRFAPGRALADAGAIVAVATNLNPGSAPCPSLPLALGLAVRQCGLRPMEALAAGTVNAAHVLGLRDRGAVRVGARADLLLLRCKDEREMVYELGDSLVDVVFAAGRIVHGA